MIFLSNIKNKSKFILGFLYIFLFSVVSISFIGKVYAFCAQGATMILWCSCKDTYCTGYNCNLNGGGMCGGCTPRNGGWSKWSPCPCEGGTQTRSCTKPKPSCGGKKCKGPSSQQCDPWYTLNVNVKEIPFILDPCSSLDSRDPANNTKVFVYKVDSLGNISGQITGSPKTTGSTGSISFSNLSLNDDNLAFTITKTTGGDAPEVYKLICPTPQTYKVDFNSQGCDIRNVTLGIQKVYKVGWTTSIDADVFADEVGVSVPAGVGLGGFSNVLINSQGVIGGYSFAKSVISTNSLRINKTGLGGYAFNLLRDNLPHDDVALEGLSFDPPHHDEVIDGFPQTFEFQSGRIYKVTSGEFNNVMSDSPGADLNYTITGGSDIVVLYITGGESVYIQRPIKTTSVSRIVIVSKPSVTISKDIGFNNIAEYTIGAAPTIMASIISYETINFESKETKPIGSDIPIKLTAPLVSKHNILAKRDLGHDINAQYPAQSVLAYPSYLYLLASLERSKIGFSNYTGLATFDVQFVYQD